MLDGQNRGLSARSNAEFGVRRREVILDCPQTEEKALSDLLVAQSLRNQLEDLPLSRTE